MNTTELKPGDAVRLPDSLGGGPAVFMKYAPPDGVMVFDGKSFALVDVPVDGPDGRCGIIVGLYASNLREIEPPLAHIHTDSTGRRWVHVDTDEEGWISIDETGPNNGDDAHDWRTWDAIHDL